MVRTLVSPLECPTAALDDLDRAATALLPPGTGPSDAKRRQTIPGIGPQTAAMRLGVLGALARFTEARALVASVGFAKKPPNRRLIFDEEDDRHRSRCGDRSRASVLGGSITHRQPAPGAGSHQSAG